MFLPAIFLIMAAFRDTLLSSFFGEMSSERKISIFFGMLFVDAIGIWFCHVIWQAFKFELAKPNHGNESAAQKGRQKETEAPKEIKIYP